MTRPRCTSRRGLLACLLASGPFGAGVPALARAAALDPRSLLERRVKAALLYRFVNYIEWPDSAFSDASAPFAMGVAGDDLLAAELTEFAAGRQVLNRPLQIRRRTDAPGLKDLHLLFVARDEAAQLTGLLRAVPANALVVTEWPGALKQGSVINFVVINGQVRFEISLEAAQRRGLRLSSRLLSVAHGVHPGAP